MPLSKTQKRMKVEDIRSGKNTRGGMVAITNFLRLEKENEKLKTELKDIKLAFRDFAKIVDRSSAE